VKKDYLAQSAQHRVFSVLSLERQEVPRLSSTSVEGCRDFLRSAVREFRYADRGQYPETALTVLERIMTGGSGMKENAMAKPGLPGGGLSEIVLTGKRFPGAIDIRFRNEEWP